MVGRSKGRSEGELRRSTEELGSKGGARKLEKREKE